MHSNEPCSLRVKLNRRRFLAGLAAGAAGSVLPSCSSAGRSGAGAVKKARWTMRLSTSSVHFRSLPLEKACERIAALGFEAIDFWPKRFGCPHLDEIETRLGPEGLKEVLARNHLKLYAFSVYATGYPKYAEILGKAGGGVAVRESRYGQASKPISAGIRDLLEQLKPEIELAEKYNSWLAIENHSGAVLNSLDSFKAFVDMNPGGRLGIALAPYHLQKERVPIDEVITLTGRQILFFYAWQLGEGLAQLPGIGPTDFTPWIRALAKADYRWYVNPFTHHDVSPDAMAEALAKSRDYLRACWANTEDQTG